jgi:hypothetical protein
MEASIGGGGGCRLLVRCILLYQRKAFQFFTETLVGRIIKNITPYMVSFVREGCVLMGG